MTTTMDNKPGAGSRPGSDNLTHRARTSELAATHGASTKASINTTTTTTFTATTTKSSSPSNNVPDEITPWYLRTSTAIALAIVQRIIVFFWGLYQDANMKPKFTDIDYFVFTDAARFMNYGGSPYERETYRYTPLLAWLLLPTSTWFFSFGKVLFAIGDIVAGYLILQILRMRGISEGKAVLYSAVWLLNPMVSTISTRGSSEGLLGAMVISFVWAVYDKRLILGGVLAGVAVHFKIYPIIYIPTVIWSLDNSPSIFRGAGSSNKLVSAALKFVNRDRVVFTVTSALSFLVFSGTMYLMYGYPFLLHTYLHHLSRIDHRHNFSPYSTLLYISSSPAVSGTIYISSGASSSLLHSITSHIPEPSKWAFLPQLFLSGILLPLLFAKRDVTKTMFLQTFAFVTFNKVCTAQYFMWYMVLLPFYLPSLTSNLPLKGKVAWVLGVVLWTGSQMLWVRQGYLLEFLGVSTFYPGLFVATILFFVVNCFCLGMFIRAV